MRRLLACLAAAFVLTGAVDVTSASGAFGLKMVETGFLDSNEESVTQAGSHPFAFTTTLAMNTVTLQDGRELPDGEVRDLKAFAPEGLIADPTAVPYCPTAKFIKVVIGDIENFCPNTAAVGLTEVNISFNPQPPESGYSFLPPVYNLPPPPGVIARFGFAVVNAPVIIDIAVTDEPPYRGVASLANIPQVAQFFGSRATIWGHPSSPAHDGERGRCAGNKSGQTCPVEELSEPFLTLPRSCTGPLESSLRVRAWNSGAIDEKTVLTQLGLSGCEKLGFNPNFAAQPTNHSAEGPTGFDFELDVKDEGLTDPEGLADSDIRKAIVTLPEGVTANPSVAEGLGTCSPSDLARETLGSSPGLGCPRASKVGTAEVETPIFKGTILKGEIFIATPDDPSSLAQGVENPFDSLLALYLVLREPQLGILIKQPMKIEPDPETGQLVATVDDIPQAPLSHVSLHFREGGRSPLITPPTCDTYTTEALFYPWADPDNPLPASTDFQITRGVGGGDCPPAGTPPFAPGFSAGTLANDAGHFSPLQLRLTRRDGDQDLTRLSATLAPGLAGILAGVSRCTDAAIALAKTKTGRQELASPSCPQSSQIGGTDAGAGVASELTYVSGELYLAGPYNGAPFSVVSITPAVAGPFDVGTVVVRFALRVDPQTAVVTVDGAASDPIPHILAGIPLRVRDLRAHADRPAFIFNPTDCDPFSIDAQIWGGGTNLFSTADDAPVSRASRFRAANCAALGFKPKMKLKLRGGVKRGGHPSFEATVIPRPGDANFSRAVVTLPRSAFLDQAHIRTICTRVQFAAAGGNGAGCPAAAIYGFAKATTPILDEPIQGPVFLRSSNHNLPDLVAALKGPPSAPVDFELVGRIDSHKGGIRGSFETIPDLPVSKFTLQMQGGKKGLIVNSRSLCARPSRAIARLRGQNGRSHNFNPQVQAAKCSKARKRQRRAG